MKPSIKIKLSLIYKKERLIMMPQSIGEKFIEETKYQYMEEKSDQMKGIPQPPLELEYNPSMRVIDLPNPRTIQIRPMDLREAIEQRRSLRSYSDTPFTLEELSYLLWCTQGVKEQLSGREQRPGRTVRNVPSAGARHAFETYLLVNKVEGLKPGIYRYRALEHVLEEFNLEEDASEKTAAACGGQRFVKNSAVTFMWTAVPYRMKWRYDERSYRYLHLDAGHVCQNLYLAAESIQSGACAIAAFEDDLMNELLHLDGVQQFIIYVGAVGKKNK